MSVDEIANSIFFFFLKWADAHNGNTLRPRIKNKKKEIFTTGHCSFHVGTDARKSSLCQLQLVGLCGVRTVLLLDLSFEKCFFNTKVTTLRNVLVLLTKIAACNIAKKNINNSRLRLRTSLCSTTKRRGDCRSGTPVLSFAVRYRLNFGKERFCFFCCMFFLIVMDEWLLSL